MKPMLLLIELETPAAQKEARMLHEERDLEEEMERFGLWRGECCHFTWGIGNEAFVSQPPFERSGNDSEVGLLTKLHRPK